MLRLRPSFASVDRTLSRGVLPVASFLVWGAVAFSAVAWGLRGWATDVRSNASPSAVQPLPEVDTAAAARSLGAAPTAAPATPTAASRFQLQGVMSGGPDAGAALLSVDGKPAKPYRVGALLAEGWVLQSVQGRRISLGVAMDGPSALVLELPAKK